MKSVWWPAKLDQQGLENEVLKLIVLNYNYTEIVVNGNDGKAVKPFEVLENIPRKRTAEWRRAYSRALDLM